MRALLTAVGGKAILGVDLRKNSPRIARAEVAGYDRYVGAKLIDAFELGNEPEAYNLGVSGVFGHLHRLSFSRLFVRYGKRFGHVASALGEAPLAGPATGSPYWLPKLGAVLGDMPVRNLKLATVHEYALKACSGETHLAVSDFFTPTAIAGLADTVHRAVEAAAQRGTPLRVAEINGDPCLGARGVSNSFGEALWALNMLPALWRAGVQGVNIQRGQDGRPPNYNYNKFITARHSSSGWRITVEPEYYGLLAFADVAPAGSHLLRISNPGLKGIYQFAVRAPDKSERVILTNVSATARTIGVSASGTHGTGSVSLLSNHSLNATTGTTLAGQSLSSRTGQLTGTSHHTLLSPNATGVYAVHVPAHTAAILTLRP
ncbi:MAG: glycosyl hydrolase family 79 C-terminal domain-containing protein [Pseudonocardiaceae bacterium]